MVVLQVDKRGKHKRGGIYRKDNENNTKLAAGAVVVQQTVRPLPPFPGP